MSFLVRTRSSPFSTVTRTVWEGDLKAKFVKLFTQRALIDPSSKTMNLPVARFITSLYDLNVLDRTDWPVARIVEDMHQRGYAKDVFTKASYGAEPPPLMTQEECLKWIAYFRVRSINRV